MELDQAKEVRKGEELDISSLKSYLTKQLAGQKELSIRQFPSGFSNLTYLVKYGAEEFVLRRPPFGSKVKSGHDMAREYNFLTALHGSYGKVPKPVLYCADEEVIGAPFYLMERVNGIILRGNIPPNQRPTETEMRLISRSTIDTLIGLHQIEMTEDLKNLGKPQGYVSRQISGWNERYTKSQTDEIPEMEDISRWLHENQPVSYGSSLIHNDFKYDNLVLSHHGGYDIMAVLDWEMATIGDPLMDLGTTLGYWVEPGDPELLIKLSLSPTHWAGNMTRMEVAQYYAERTHSSLENIVFYYIQGIFKIAVIVQQIYYRFKKGHTQDPRFSNLIHAVHAFGKLGQTAIDGDKIS